MNLSVMTIVELRKLMAAVEKEINTRHKLQRNKALEEIKSIAVKYGLKLTDVVGDPSPAKKSQTRTDKTINAVKKKPTKKSRIIVYRHPENPALTWGGGRGRRPRWVNEWEASGRKIEETRIA